MVDAFTMGYCFALLVNVFFEHYENARYNAELFSSRVSLIREHPEKILPLVCTKCETDDAYWWIFPIRISTIFHVKLTEAELLVGGGVSIAIAVVSLWLGTIPGWLIGILTLVLDIAIWASQIAYYNAGVDGAWISIEAQIFPILGVWLQGRGPSGNVVLPIPVTPGDPISTTALSIIFRENLHDWTCS